jgi:hypothetical protein
VETNQKEYFEIKIHPIMGLSVRIEIGLRQSRRKRKETCRMSLKSTISAAELDELIKNWGISSPERIDRFFPVRFWLLVVIVGVFLYRLLFDTDRTAHFLSTDPQEIQRLMSFLYFRGWFILVMSIIYAYSYLKSRYFGIISFAIIIIVMVNFSFDLFGIYHDLFDKPPRQLTLLILIRFVAMYCIYCNLSNYQNLPPSSDRLNIFLPFKHKRVGN